ncbi:hypothetical protein BROUX41_001299 [Berkeleyomyces rouxiae]|uniref:uncharacterized protein n=1 Tax=Berkeleyomyces rouxiae TaxID=2035830 RepID=UPI003B7DB505
METHQQYSTGSPAKLSCDTASALPRPPQTSAAPGPAAPFSHRLSVWQDPARLLDRLPSIDSLPALEAPLRSAYDSCPPSQAASSEAQPQPHSLSLPPLPHLLPYSHPARPQSSPLHPQATEPSGAALGAAVSEPSRALLLPATAGVSAISRQLSVHESAVPLDASASGAAATKPQFEPRQTLDTTLVSLVPSAQTPIPPSQPQTCTAPSVATLEASHTVADLSAKASSQFCSQGSVSGTEESASIRLSSSLKPDSKPPQQPQTLSLQAQTEQVSTVTPVLTELPIEPSAPPNLQIQPSSVQPQEPLPAATAPSAVIEAPLISQSTPVAQPPPPNPSTQATPRTMDLSNVCGLPQLLSHNQSAGYPPNLLSASASGVYAQNLQQAFPLNFGAALQQQQFLSQQNYNALLSNSLSLKAPEALGLVGFPVAEPSCQPTIQTQAHKLLVEQLLASQPARQQILTQQQQQQLAHLYELQQQQQQQQQLQQQQQQVPVLAIKRPRPADDPPQSSAKRSKPSPSLPNPLPPPDPPMKSRMASALLALNPELASHPMWSSVVASAPEPAPAAEKANAQSQEALKTVELTTEAQGIRHANYSSLVHGNSVGPEDSSLLQIPQAKASEGPEETTSSKLPPQTTINLPDGLSEAQMEAVKTLLPRLFPTKSENQLSHPTPPAANISMVEPVPNQSLLSYQGIPFLPQPEQSQSLQQQQQQQRHALALALAADSPTSSLLLQPQSQAQAGQAGVTLAQAQLAYQPVDHRLAALGTQAAGAQYTGLVTPNGGLGGASAGILSDSQNLQQQLQQLRQLQRLRQMTHAQQQQQQQQQQLSRRRLTLSQQQASQPTAPSQFSSHPSPSRAPDTPEPGFIKHVIIDILDSILETMPLDQIAKRQSLAPQKVRAIFEALVQVPMLRYPGDKRKVSKFALNKLREYHEAKKKMVSGAGGSVAVKTDGAAPQMPFALAKFMGESGPKDYPAGVPTW